MQLLTGVKVMLGQIRVAVAMFTIGVISAATQLHAEVVEAEHDAAVEKGVQFLLTKGQATDGSFSKQTGTGITSLCVTALLRNGRSPDDPGVAKGLKYLEANIRPDGGIYAENSRLKNYETCIGLMCLKEANRNGKYDKAIDDAERYIKGLQLDAGENKQPSDFEYGGVGYTANGRPDLSNTAFLMDALIASGNGPEDEAVKKALIFISRCQNLESEHNTTPHAAKINDGGFYYSVTDEPDDAKDKSAGGGLRSYGSMTYAGLKSMVHAGLKPDDPRVKAALSWLGKHYDLDSNPGMGDAGLYYYYHLMAKALDALGQQHFVDASGKKHDWRAELTAELASRQNADGSWVNRNNRWLESDANLVTAFALLALSHCK
jgi:squalene-hopene/tetraprenyl-beta-curcumene cyclase